MDTNTLKELLAACFDSQAGRLTLPADKLGSASVRELIVNSVRQNPLVLERAAAQPAPDGDVSYAGVASVSGFSGARAVASFSVVDGNAEMTLSLSPPAGWSLASAFPQLQKTFFESLTLAPDAGQSRPAIVFSSYEHEADGPGGGKIKLARGVNADLAVSTSGEPFAYLSPLLQGASRLEFAGPIVPQERGPNMYLEAADALSISGVLDSPLPLRMALRSTFAKEGDIPLQEQGLELSTELPVGDVVLHLSTLLPAERVGIFKLQGKFDNLALPSPTALAKLIGQEDLMSSLPPFLQNDEGITIKSLELGIELDKRKLTYALIALETLRVRPLEIIPGQLSLSNLVVRFQAFDPLESTRKLVVQLLGTFSFPTANPILEMEVSAQGPDFALEATLKDGTTFNLKDLLAYLSPQLKDAPDLVFTNLLFSARLAGTGPQFSFEAAMQDVWEVNVGGTPLFGIEEASFSFNNAGAGGKLGGDIAGTFSVGGVQATIGGQLDDQLTLTGTVPKLNLSAIASDLLGGVSLPDELPDIEFSDLSLSVTPKTGEFAFAGKSTASWDLPFGVQGLAVSTVEINLRRAPATAANGQTRPGPLSCSLRLTGQGPVPVVEGLTFNRLSLGFDLVGGTSWALSGSIAATVFDADYTLAAALEQTPSQRKISLSATTTAASLVNIEGVGSLSGKSIVVNIVKPLQPSTAPQGTGGAATAGTATTGSTTTGGSTGSAAAGGSAGGSSLSMSASSAYLWDVTIAGGLKVTDILDLEGVLQLYKRADRTGLDFKAQKAEVRIPLPVPQQSIEFHLNLERISVVRMAGAAGASSWMFDAAVDVWFTGLPESIQKILAQKSVGQFKVDQTGTQISVDRLLQPLEIDLPDARVGDADIKLGTMLLDASNLMLRMQGSALTLSADFGVGLPENLNDVFGKKEDGTPSMVFFNTYVKGKPETVTKFKLGIASAGGLTIQPVTSPIAAVRTVMEGTIAWWYVDLGEFGKAKLMVPVFGYTGDSFVARGGFQQIEPLKVPLTPFKLLLSACGLDAVADALPKGLPIEEIKLYDEGRKDFNIDEFFSTLERIGGFKLPPEVKEAVGFIEGRLDLLPDRFKSYLDIEIPEGFQFSFAVRPDGGASGRVWVEGDRPIKLLYPTVGLAGPQINGIELYGLTFGEMLGGSLVFLRVDARVDQFDLLMLAAALALPLEQLPILPSTRALSRRFIIKDLFMFIVYQAGVPVPVPLFYDELGLEYLGIEGLEFQTHWAFPKPSLNPSDALQVFNNFKRFFTEHDYLLDADAPPQGFDLKLTVGPNYFALPKYLGGKSLGSKDDRTVVSAYENLAHLLNALKTLSLNEIVRALPLDKRVGKERVAFAAMSLEIDWLITTPQEFRSLSYKQLKVADDKVEDILQIVPAAPGKDLQGLIILLKGSWQIADAFSLATCFGLVGTSGGFATGMSIDGKLSELLTVEMSGAVVINTKGPDYFALNGHSAVTILDHRLFTGDVQIDDANFFLEGRLDVFPASSPLQIGGEAKLTINDGGQIYFRGATNVSLKNFVLQSSEITVTNTSLVVTGSWLGRTVTFGIVVEGRDFILSGSVVFDLALKFSTGPIYEPKTGLKLTDGINLDTRANASLAVSLGTFGFTAEIDAGFRWNDFQLKAPQFRIDVSPSDVKQLTGTVADQIRNKASEIFAATFKSVGEWLKAGVAGVVQLSGEWNDAVGAARKWGKAGWDATAQWSAKAWQSASKWKASAWRATTKWSEEAWRSTTQWGDEAWDATVEWTDEAWDATAEWSEDAWRATTKWSGDAWKATTGWSADTWRDTARWPKEVWDNTANWTASEWNDATKTVEKFFKSIHGDVSFIPHIDTNFIPHGDVNLIPHGDVKLIPHGDAKAASHGDVKLVPHGDVKLVPHGDVKLIPHADFYTIPHGDVKGTHLDVKKKKVAGVTVVPHGDSRVGHIDTPHAGHVDEASTGHIDAPSTGHIDTAPAAHIDTPNILHIDTPSTAHVDTPTTAHIDTPATAHGDTPSTAHIDSP